MEEGHRAFVHPAAPPEVVDRQVFAHLAAHQIKAAPQMFVHPVALPEVADPQVLVFQVVYQVEVVPPSQIDRSSSIRPSSRSTTRGR